MDEIVGSPRSHFSDCEENAEKYAGQQFWPNLFMGRWLEGKPVYEPLIEAVMVGFAGANGISFTSPGRALIEREE